jgi:hypothetical protein
MSLSTWDTISTWIFHPGAYEMIWYTLICVVWYGFMTERRLKNIQERLDEMTEGNSQTPPLR